MLKVAILTGGNVAERSVSLKSAETVRKHLNDQKYEKYVIELNGTQFTEQGTGVVVNLNDFSLPTPNGNIKFDLVYQMLHGHPAEDGCLQGYFEVLGIPYTGCEVMASAITFNKQACKDFLRSHNIPMAPSKVLRKGETINWVELEAMGVPVFVKPNKNGSSYGASKVNTPDQLAGAIEHAFVYDDEVVVEGFLKGTEFSNGVLRRNGEVVVLPITEIVPHNEFFDFKAKYENQSQEITPARLTPEQTAQVQAQTKLIYEAVGCRGICRFDYILVGDTFFFLEANTIPGMSEQSIVPQQARAHGWSITELLDAAVDEALERQAMKLSVGN
ncbi:MAG TPA: D-alanine--D-alanine ligase [Haliscomenobacter sp.]|nr:D-alanine--D-alanine ligase [Haliscomenobacter sp.]